MKATRYVIGAAVCATLCESAYPEEPPPESFKCEELEAAAAAESAKETDLLKAAECLKGARRNKKAERILRRAAEMGGMDSYRLLGNFLHEKNSTEVVTWWEKAAEMGDGGAEANLGTLYLHGGSVEQDVQRGYDYMKSASEKGDPTALYNMGEILASGLDMIAIEKDIRGAQRYMYKAAEKQHAGAIVWLALRMKDKKGRMKKSAKEWLIRAARMKHADAMAVLGYMYKRGEGVKQDFDTAYEWYDKGAKQGSVTAQYELGLMYLTDEGVDQDDVLGRKWMGEAAYGGHAKAQHNYANLLLLELENDPRTKKQMESDRELALKFYAAAASDGVPESMYLLGMFHYRGEEGVQQDYEVAAQYWGQGSLRGHKNSQQSLHTLVSKTGHAEAQFQLAEMYVSGPPGIEVDLEHARELYQKAVDQGHQRAVKRLQQVPDPRAARKQREEQAERRRLKREAALEELIDIDELSEAEKEAQEEERLAAEKATTCEDPEQLNQPDDEEEHDDEGEETTREQDRALTAEEEDAAIEDERLGII